MRNQQPQTEADTVCFFPIFIAKNYRHFWPLARLSFKVSTFLPRFFPRFVPIIPNDFLPNCSQCFPTFFHIFRFPQFVSLIFATPSQRNRMELNPQKREKTSSLEIQTCRVKPCYINHFKPLEMSLGNSWRSLPAAT